MKDLLQVLRPHRTITEAALLVGGGGVLDTHLAEFGVETATPVRERVAKDDEDGLT